MKKESLIIELKRDFEEFIKKEKSDKGLIVNRILFDITPAIEIIKDIEENNLYKIEFYLDFYIPEGAKANFAITYNFAKNTLTKNAEVIQLKHNFDYSLISRPAILITEIFTHIPVFSKNFFKNKGDIYKLTRYPDLSEHENYSSFYLITVNVLIDYTYSRTKNSNP
jgi:hypothetical protein